MNSSQSQFSACNCTIKDDLRNNPRVLLLLFFCLISSWDVQVFFFFSLFVSRVWAIFLWSGLVTPPQPQRLTQLIPWNRAATLRRRRRRRRRCRAKPQKRKKKKREKVQTNSLWSFSSSYDRCKWVPVKKRDTTNRKRDQQCIVCFVEVFFIAVYGRRSSAATAPTLLLSVIFLSLFTSAV